MSSSEMCPTCGPSCDASRHPLVRSWVPAEPGSWEVRLGDCVAHLRALPDSSVDAIVTDPPYALTADSANWRAKSGDSFEARPELAAPRSSARKRGGGGGFMGKAWDSELPGVEMWAEALRVLKPGGHLLAFGGSRTYHRLTCAIEDAGFEIRDCLSWLYGSGFPKSMDVSKAIDRCFRREDGAEAYEWRPASGPTADVYAVTGFVKAARDRAGVTNRKIDALFGFNGMAGHWVSTGSQPAVPTWPQWEKLRELLGFGDEMDAMVVALNGGKGDRSIEGTALADREVLGMARGKDAVEGELYAPGTGPYVPKDYAITAPASGPARAWAGWGTALKPAWEPIVMARKPVVSTVAANVIAHGTGALNVDGCRIGSAERINAPASSLGANGILNHGRDWSEQNAEAHSVAGRWPANVLLAHGAGCELVGTREVRTGVAVKRNGSDPKAARDWMFVGIGRAPAGTPDATYAGPDGLETIEAWKCQPDCPVRLLDEQSAGASRFFYTAKASTSERTIGLERVEAVDRNTHPTVKPVDVMAWLCRLVTPPGGLVLDPFTGSGSTGIAALREGFRFLGFEREAEYVEIARRRIAGDAPLFNQGGPVIDDDGAAR